MRICHMVLWEWNVSVCEREKRENEMGERKKKTSETSYRMKEFGRLERFPRFPSEIRHN